MRTFEPVRAEKVARPTMALPRVRSAVTRAGPESRSLSSTTRRAPWPRTRAESLTLRVFLGAAVVGAGAVAAGLVGVAADPVVDVVVCALLVVVVVGRGRDGVVASTVVVGRGREGTVVATVVVTHGSRGSGTQSAAAAGPLENATAATNPAAKTVAAAIAWAIRLRAGPGVSVREEGRAAIEISRGVGGPAGHVNGFGSHRAVRGVRSSHFGGAGAPRTG